MVISYYGYLANNVDFQIKDLLMELSKDCIEIKTLCDKGKVWAKKTTDAEDEDQKLYLKRGNIYMMQKTSEGYISNTGELLEVLDGYEDVNDRVEHQVGDLATSLDTVISRVDYKIEYNQLQFYGFTLNFEFLVEFFGIVVSLLIGIIQQVYEE